MIPFNNTQGGGLIRLVIFIILILLVLAYFGFNLRGIIASPTFQDNWNFVGGVIASVWNNYLSRPFNYLYNQIFIPLIWQPAVSVLTRMKNDGTPVILQSQTPQMPTSTIP